MKKKVFLFLMVLFAITSPLISYFTFTTIPVKTLFVNTLEGIQYSGNLHSAFMTDEGRVYMWGSNHYGQLGDGTTTEQNVPTDITSRFTLAEGDRITSLSLGSSYSSAVSSSGRIFMWGYNHYGQLGDGTTTNRHVPTDITSRFTLAEGDRITSLSLGSEHSSAVSSSGRIFMWGRNDFGELGDGTTTNRHVPTDITSRFTLAEGDRITSLSLGSVHSSAVSSSGRVFIWGYTYFRGQLGDRTTTEQNVPTDITSN